jgi:hypothetical protein
MVGYFGRETYHGCVFAEKIWELLRTRRAEDEARGVVREKGEAGRDKALVMSA